MSRRQMLVTAGSLCPDSLPDSQAGGPSFFRWNSGGALGQCDFPMGAVNRARSGSPHPSSGPGTPSPLPDLGAGLGTPVGGTSTQLKGCELDPSTQLTDSQPEAGAELGSLAMRASEDHRRRDVPWAGQPPGPTATWHAAPQPSADDRLPLGPQREQSGRGLTSSILSFNPWLRVRRPETKGPGQMSLRL